MYYKIFQDPYLLVVCICILIFVILFIYNNITGVKGTFINHIPFVVDLLFKPTMIKKKYESKGELECKRSIQKLTGKEFVKVRPSFLLNQITKQNLELDCYNDELKIAVEYNGKQHYVYTPYFHKNKEDFVNTQYRDMIKKDLCFKNGVKLIVVPYTVKYQDIELFIKRNL
jgi:hypothetical protein